MSFDNLKIFINICIISGLFIAILLYGCANLPHDYSQNAHEKSDVEPQVRSNAGLLQRSSIPASTVSYCSDVVYTDVDPSNSGFEIVAVGTDGVSVFSSAYQLIRHTDFKSKSWWKVLDKRSEFGNMFELCITSTCGGPGLRFFSWDNQYGGVPVLVAADGNAVWTLDRPEISRSPFNGSFGDVDGDHEMEFCIQYFKHSPHVLLLDEYGQEMWAKNIETSEPPAIKILGPAMPDINNDGKSEIVGSDCRRIYVYDANGDETRTIRIAHSNGLVYEHMRVVTNLIGEEDYIIANDNGKGWFFIPFRDDGEWIYTGTNAPPLVPVVARYVRFMPEETFLVVSAAPSRQDMTIPGFEAGGRLSIRNTKGDVVYYELLPFHPEALCVIPNTETKNEDLLVAGSGRIYRYSAK